MMPLKTTYPEYHRKENRMAKKKDKGVMKANANRGASYNTNPSIIWHKEKPFCIAISPHHQRDQRRQKETKGVDEQVQATKGNAVQK